MSDDNKKKLGGKLQLTRSLETKLQHNMSKGRAKTVTVEVKKTRTVTRDKDGKISLKPRNMETPQTSTTPEQEAKLSSHEQAARMEALKRAEELSTSAEAQSSQPDLPKPRVKKVVSNDDPKAEAAEKQAEAEKQAMAAAAAAGNATSGTTQQAGAAATPDKSKELAKKDEQKRKLKGVKEDKGHKKKLTIANALDFDRGERVRSLASVKRQRAKEKRQGDDFGTGEQKQREVVITEMITVQELANRMAVRAADVIKELMKLGIMARQDQAIDADTAELVVTEFGHTFKRVTDADVEDVLIEEEVNEADLETRPPVVTIMGHVDHGKTSLLDALRESSVTDGEAGGITQHIGAYQYKTADGKLISFIDTPGHAAFTAMRARGASVTDIVILIVAADDGIMPQTEEAISHAKAAEVPIIVAINKIDKPDANPQKVKDQLLSHELIPEDLGGDVQVVEISAAQKLNLDELVDIILLQAEMLDLKASPKQTAIGSVLEAKVDKGRGNVVTVLVQRGTLRKGDIGIAGTGFGKIKALTDENGKQLKEAGPSAPVEILGLDQLPQAGDVFNVVEQEKDAREIIEYREKKLLEQKSASAVKTVDDIFKQTADSKELNLLIKGDVQGSVEAIIGSLNQIEHEEVVIKIVHSGAGAVTESDVTLANATNAAILAFNVRAAGAVKTAAENESVEIHYYSIIYDLIDDVKNLVNGLASPKIREEFIGYAEILEVFKITRVGKVAGCRVTEGLVERGAGVRLLRENVVIHTGKLKTLKRFKEEADEVKEGTECGMAFENYEDIKAGDVIEAYRIIEEQVTVS